MAANTSPIFIGTPNNAFATLTSAEGSTNADGSGTNTSLFTAGTNGSYLRRLLVKPIGTNVASVLRVYLNNGSAHGTASNNALLKELTLAASTQSNTAPGGPDYEITLNLVIKASYAIIVGLGTAVSAGWTVTAEYGDF
jgi:hypothetical protein